MESFEPKCVNPNHVWYGVNSLKLGGLHIILTGYKNQENRPNKRNHHFYINYRMSLIRSTSYSYHSLYLCLIFSTNMLMSGGDKTLQSVWHARDMALQMTMPLRRVNTIKSHRTDFFDLKIRFQRINLPNSFGFRYIQLHNFW